MGAGTGARRGAAASACTARRGAAAFVVLLLVFYVACCVSFYSRASASTSADAAAALPAAPSALWLSAHLSALKRGLRAPAPADAEADEAATRAELGRGSWNLLHRLAAQYSKEATVAEQEGALRFFAALGDLYPCHECAAHFREMLASRPLQPHVASNSALSLWLCALHNEVNARLLKPAFPCTLEALKERWGSCGCFGNGTAAAR